MNYTKFILVALAGAFLFSAPTPAASTTAGDLLEVCKVYEVVGSSPKSIEQAALAGACIGWMDGFVNGASGMSVASKDGESILVVHFVPDITVDQYIHALVKYANAHPETPLTARATSLAIEALLDAKFVVVEKQKLVQAGCLQ